MLQVYNTLFRQKEIFQPIYPGKVSVYVCGVTVYDYCHLGHARTYTSADVIVRYLRWQGYEVKYVRNITDVDDKIIKRANENKEDFHAVAQRFTEAMHEDFSTLGLTLPDHEPRATEYIPQMVAVIEKIIANSHAYIGENGDVYFDVRSFPNYGCLSHHNIEQLESGARVEISEVKRDPLDFVLWKLAKPGEPSWDSPWGKGRPGWHIECSAMAMDLLGEHFDIHAGGRDLIFPHHENENAQSQAALPTKFVNVWMHTGFLQMEKEKMSKSLGNFITIRDVLREHEPEVLRFFLMSSHYRSPLIYTSDALHQARQALVRFYTALRFLPEVKHPHQTKYEAQFVAAMNDDFNTPVALSVLFDLAHEIQRLREQDINTAAQYGALLKYLGSVIGILQTNTEVFFQAGSSVDSVKVEKLIQARQQARQNKNWVEADRIRDELASMYIAIEDSPQGTTWKFLK
ncbi:MAG: cysteine--tRNA ligase [Gammaproteobacteria bacterium]|nr:cysteine--tRNA ligase [Gammaproteobacteria bacterium]MCW5583761.1 cysteine--tRNA ligase [Gammaproteobacteria bacterium]